MIESCRGIDFDFDSYLHNWKKSATQRLSGLQHGYVARLVFGDDSLFVRLLVFGRTAGSRSRVQWGFVPSVAPDSQVLLLVLVGGEILVPPLVCGPPRESHAIRSMWTGLNNSHY